MASVMRKILLTALFSLTVFFRASSPDMVGILLISPPPVEAYARLIAAIGMVETMNDNNAYNPREEAAGIFQIRPIRLSDYNRRTGSSYTTRDLFRYEVSKKIFVYYADQIGPHDFEQIARKWNGSGHKTTYYWNRIKTCL
jgi:hypothetical protein